MADEPIILDKPEQINMWVLLSRRHQIQLHLKGYPQKGLLKSVNKTLGSNYKRVKDLVVPIEHEISVNGGQADYKLVNVHVMERVRSDVFQDLGIYSEMSEVEASPYFVELWQNERLEIVFTLEEPRGPNGNLFTVA